MAKKPARKSLPDANGSVPNQPTEHPALTLHHALNCIEGVFHNAHLFRDFAERRKEARESRRANVNFLLSEASKRANARASAEGNSAGPFVGSFLKENSDLIEAADSAPPSNEPAEYLKALRDMLGDGRKLCERAREALRGGGAHGLDAALTPGAAVRSVEIGVKLREAESVLGRLELGLGRPSFDIARDAEAMGGLGDWFGRACAELSVVLETRGMNAPRNGNSETRSGDGRKPKRRTRRPSLQRQERPLTAVERRTLEVVGRHGGNLAAAAKEMRVDRKTVVENHERAMRKANRIVGGKSRSVSASKLPEDRRGQVDIDCGGGKAGVRKGVAR